MIFLNGRNGDISKWWTHTLVERFASDVTQLFHRGDQLRVNSSADLISTLNQKG